METTKWEPGNGEELSLIVPTGHEVGLVGDHPAGPSTHVMVGFTLGEKWIAPVRLRPADARALRDALSEALAKLPQSDEVSTAPIRPGGQLKSLRPDGFAVMTTADAPDGLPQRVGIAFQFVEALLPVIELPLAGAEGLRDGLNAAIASMRSA